MSAAGIDYKLKKKCTGLISRLVSDGDILAGVLQSVVYGVGCYIWWYQSRDRIPGDK